MLFGPAQWSWPRRLAALLTAMIDDNTIAIAKVLFAFLDVLTRDKSSIHVVQYVVLLVALNL